jgi:hypothetical protein
VSTNIRLAWFTLFIIFLAAFLIYLSLKAGKDYSVEDTEANAEEFGGLVKEGHGPVPAIAAIGMGALIIWSVVYLIMHWNQYAVAFFR